MGDHAALESVAVNLFSDRYRGRRVLVTGHTGFKGSWLAHWLAELGAEVVGISLDPSTVPAHWSLLGLSILDHRVDIRDAAALGRVVRDARPEVVFHLAAQALVRASYRDPLGTWSTNVMGTANVLDACRNTPSVRAIVVVTSDKCYENQEWDRAYRETDRLGGHDPYSASKAGAELVASSYRDAFFGRAGAPLLATARAGNVIGGGDWAEDRLIPDLVRAITTRSTLMIRSPRATRPWQHALESLSGYLLLGQMLLEGRRDFAEAWNFGPAPEGNQPVGELLARLGALWPEFSWELSSDPKPHEATLLNLDSAKARERLGWAPVWTLDDALGKTAEWYRTFLRTGELMTSAQLRAFAERARANGLAWASA